LTADGTSLTPTGEASYQPVITSEARDLAVAVVVITAEARDLAVAAVVITSEARDLAVSPAILALSAGSA